MTRLQSLEIKLYYAELCMEHDRVRAIKQGIKRLKGQTRKPCIESIVYPHDRFWMCHQGLVVGVGNDVAQAWETFCRQLDGLGRSQAGGAA